MELEFTRFTPIEPHVWAAPTVSIIREILPAQYMNTQHKVDEALQVHRYEYYGFKDTDGSFVGFGSLDPQFDEFEEGYEVPYLGVVPEKRAQKYGRVILGYLETMAKTRGQTYLYLCDTATSSTFYESLEYKPKALGFQYKTL